jgi:threonylcarbamoyladenosine tRNA methylthiotransferase MtaB
MTPPGAPSVSLRTLGCKVNQAESEEIASALIEIGHRLSTAGTADVVVVNSCCVTAAAERKVRKAVRRALADAPDATVVVTGCLATIDAAGVAGLGPRVVVERDKSRIAERVDEIVGRPGVRAASSEPEIADRSRTRAMVKVQDGCDAGCAYCIVPSARGAPRSVASAEIVDRVAALAERGVAECVLTGVNLGRYADSGIGLGGLVMRVAETGIRRVRLSSVEPLDLTDELLSVLGSIPAVCPHLHVPLQSGSDGVLERMARGYTSAAYLEALSRARAAIPGLEVTTDVLVGFPGETPHESEESISVVRRAGFAKLHVFPFSSRPGTTAADAPAQLDPAKKRERAAAMRRVGDDLAHAFHERMTGVTAEVLVERVREDRAAEGTTGEYVKARLPGAELQVGQVVLAELTGSDGAYMSARVVE